MIDGVAPDEDDVRLALHVICVRVAEHDIDAVHQLHLYLALVLAERAAVGQSVGVEPEVRAVVARLHRVVQSVADPVVEFPLLHQVLHGGVGELRSVVLRVGHVAAVVISKRLEPDGRAARRQRSDEQTRHSFQYVEHGLRQLAHRRSVRQMEPLIPDEELRVRLDHAVLVGDELVVVRHAALVQLPCLGLTVLYRRVGQRHSPLFVSWSLGFASSIP